QNPGWWSRGGRVGLAGRPIGGGVGAPAAAAARLRTRSNVNAASSLRSAPTATTAATSSASRSTLGSGWVPREWKAAGDSPPRDARRALLAQPIDAGVGVGPTVVEAAGDQPAQMWPLLREIEEQRSGWDQQPDAVVHGVHVIPQRLVGQEVEPLPV